MYSGALIGARIQGSGFSFLRPRIKRQKTQWSIQNVRGKVTPRCLWHACKALMVGIFLIMVGAAMATVGYYADELAMEEERQGNRTIITKNPSKGFHLNNLSYVGPVIMGFGGFVIVTACVMTFEARDSAAKIVPARFRSKAITPPTLSTATSTAVNEGITPNGTTTLYPPNNDYRQRVSSVTHSAGKNVEAAERQTITQSFIQFSKNLQNSIDSGEYLNVQHPHCATLKRSPSAPTLLTDCHQRTFLNLATSDLNSNNEKLFPMLNADIKRLQVNLLPRQAISVDNPHDIYHSANSHCVCNIEDIQRTVTPSDMELEVGTSSASVHQTDSEASMTMDLHLPDCSITITVKDESKRPKHYGSSQECPSSTASQSSEVMLVPSPKLNSKVADRPSAADLGRRETNRRRPLLRQSQVEHGDSDTESNTKEEDENKDLS